MISINSKPISTGTRFAQKGMAYSATRVHGKSMVKIGRSGDFNSRYARPSDYARGQAS